jgi:hypothetical protein
VTLFLIPPSLIFPSFLARRVSYGVRFYYLIREGLLLHPNLNLVDTPTAADIIIYLPESAAWEKSECNQPEYASKLVVLDESDGSHIMERPTSPWNLMYFKRSYIHRQNGVRHQPLPRFPPSPLSLPHFFVSLAYLSLTLLWLL